MSEKKISIPKDILQRAMFNSIIQTNAERPLLSRLLIKQSKDYINGPRFNKK